MRPCGHWIEGTKGTSSRKVATKHLRHEAKVSTFGFFSPRDITFYFSLNLSYYRRTHGDERCAGSMYWCTCTVLVSLAQIPDREWPTPWPVEEEGRGKSVGRWNHPLLILFAPQFFLLLPSTPSTPPRQQVAANYHHHHRRLLREIRFRVCGGTCTKREKFRERGRERIVDGATEEEEERQEGWERRVALRVPDPFIPRGSPHRWLRSSIDRPRSAGPSLPRPTIR